MPIARGLGVPARLSCVSMYCISRFDGMPVEPQFCRHILDRPVAAAPADIISKALGVERIVGQKVEPLALHLAATTTIDPPHLQFEENPRVTARQVTHPTGLAVVPPHVDVTATAAGRFFERRLSRITRAVGAPKTPRTVGFGVKTGEA